VYVGLGAIVNSRNALAALISTAGGTKVRAVGAWERMILTFADVITAEEQQKILAMLEGAPFVDGRTTAGVAAAQVKNNEQLSRDAPAYREITDIVLNALRRNDTFRAAVLPKQLHSMIVNRCGPGMSYGFHVDNATMLNGEDLWRSDVSMTLFLNERTEYEGGELGVESGSGELQFKLRARAMVCYPSTSLHRVMTVTKGTRLAVVAWIHSLVRDPAEREILYDLHTASRRIFDQCGKSREYDLISKTLANLTRRWAEM